MTHVQFKKFGRIYPIAGTTFTPEVSGGEGRWIPEIHVKQPRCDMYVQLDTQCDTREEALTSADQAIKRGIQTQEAFDA